MDIAQNIKSMERRIANLAKKQGISADDLEEKYRSKFERFATHIGNGIYHWMGLNSTDTRELFLLGVLVWEKQPLKNNYHK